MEKLRFHSLIAELSALLIVLGTAIDIFWSVALVETLAENELNPIAKEIILGGNEFFSNGLSNSWKTPFYGVGLLCAIKVMTTWFTLRVCRIIYQKRPNLGLIAFGGIALFQIGLVLFLLYGHVLFKH